MTFSAMNTTDFQNLLTAPTVSRAAFFAHYLGTSHDLGETPVAEPQSPTGPPATNAPPLAPEPALKEDRD